ncbi:MAG TPA: hypothetical protein PKA62_03975 [Thermoanaerobaculia bacterium]|nr:hypothetical protein [Thermoanaerobaculia bacterium]
MSRPAAPRAAQNLPGAILVALSLVASFAAQASPWSPVGPPGGAAYGLAVDPKDANVLYAGAFGGGVWKSTDGGASWSRLAGLPAQETVNAVAVSPADSRTVLAAGFTALWRSADAGATWKKVLDQKVQQPAMTGFAFDPTAPATVYASADNDGFPTGVFKSTDSGATWKPANTGINPNSRVRGVAVSRDGKSVFAASEDGVYLSTDGGASWTVALPRKAAHSVATGDGLVLAGTNGDGVLRSTDGGKSWEETTTDAKWVGNIVYSIVASTATPGLCYASIPNRVLRSTDGGATWKTFSRGFNWVNFRSLALDEKGGAVWAGSGRDGVVKTTDGGATWTTGAGFLALEVKAILLDPSAPKRLFVGTTQGGVHLSEDGGATWALSNEGLTNRAAHSLAADPSAPGTFLAGTRKGAFRSTDGGRSWTHVLKGGCEPEVQHLRYAPSDPKRVYAHSGRDFCQVARSDDGGLTWRDLKAPRDASSLLGHFAFHVDAANADRAFYSDDRHLYLTADGGATWTTAAGIPPTSRIQAIVAGSGADELFAATNKGIYRSADGGKSWAVAGTGTEKSNVRRILLDPASGTLYAGAWKEGVLRSRDGGKTWAPFGGEPPHPDVVALALESPTSLLVGFEGNGVWRLDLAAAASAAASPTVPKPAAAPKAAPRPKKK